ncbi:MAG: Lrp/AsnC family transcriptional regulator [Candidatus Hodarchaeota archaeon]
MDSIDKQILWELIQNCRISFRDLGTKLNLSPSSVKKRIDNLEQSGFIDHYSVVLHPEHINVRYATLMVYTNAAVKIDAFSDIAMTFDGVYMILPLIDGSFYVSIEYSKQSELAAFSNLLRTIPGVQRTDVYDVLPEGAKSELPDTPEFSKDELIVLSQLAIDPRMMDYDVATKIGWSAKKTKQVLQKLETEQKVVFGARWNPNLGRDVAFNLIIRYDPEVTSARDITNWLDDKYPVVYVNSRVVESKCTIFAVFTLERVVDMEPIAMEVLDYAGVQSAYAITYYNAIVGKTLSRLRLERILEEEGLWPPDDD